MRRFFAEKIENNTAVLTGSEAEHLSRVLRLKAGDPILVAGEGEEYVCRLVQVEKQRAEAEILQIRPCLADPRRRITLYLAYMKSDKMEIVAQKAVELGVSALRPFISSRCVKVPEEKAAAKARERMSRIAFEALKQCGRTRAMEVGMPLSFSEFLQEISGHALTLFAYEQSQKPLKEALCGAEDIALIVGPEGGFSPEEAAEIEAAGARQVSLGRRILRGETAAIALAAIVAYETEC